jgi:hypothetical protein
MADPRKGGTEGVAIPAPSRTPRGVRGIGLLGISAFAALMLSASLPVRLSAQAEPQTIRPGMTEAEVRAAWGEPLTARKTGPMTYLYYRNDCHKRCGTHDVVFLEGGQVIDAIVRDSRRRYDGVSSSPAERKPEATKS